MNKATLNSNPPSFYVYTGKGGRVQEMLVRQVEADHAGHWRPNEGFLFQPLGSGEGMRGNRFTFY